MSTRTLFLLRHAKSDWSTSLPDFDRPLAERGRAQAPLAGKWLGEHAAPIDLAIVSPARRTRETWESARAELASAPVTRFDDRVYLASAAELLALVREVPAETRTLVLVGHNSGMEELATRLAGAELTMRTAGIAEFEVDGPWAALDAASAVLRAAGRSDGHELS